VTALEHGDIERTTWAGVVWLTAFAIAMAQVEAAVVIYLRRLYYADDPLTLFPLVMLPQPDLAIELARELATIVMIFSIALVHARRGTHLFGAFLYVFGVWDLAYYGWLELLLGWPKAWLEWDVLFLIPWPWLGPWIAPALVAAAFAVFGLRILRSSFAGGLRTRAAPLAFVAGAAIVVAVFLWPGLPFVAGDVPPGGYRPAGFPWVAFGVGYAVMSFGLFATAPATARPA
jgi:hypothetical protein